MNRLLIVSMLLLSTSAMAVERHLQDHSITPPREVIHPIGGPIKIDHVPGHNGGDHDYHNHDHIHPLCSCIGNIHLPFEKKDYQPNKLQPITLKGK